MERKSKIVLQNRLGETVRILDKLPSEFDVIFRLDTKRIEVLHKNKRLNKETTPFVKLLTIKRDEINQKGVEIKNYGKIVKTNRFNNISKSPQLKQDNNVVFIKSLKVSAASQIAFVIFALLLAYFTSPENKVKPKEVVTIKLKKNIPLPKPTVTVSDKKVAKKKVPKKKVAKAKKIKKISKKQNLVKRPKRAKKRTGKQEVALNQKGALGILGSLSKKSKQRGGINLNKVNTSVGAGLGGKAGSGGVQTSIYAKGLKSAPTGVGGKIQGAGGYGTKGKGGGKAGYGKLSLAGGSAAYFKPLTSQALVRGGLDKSQVAAVVNRHLGQVRYCYEKGLQANPALRGRLKMNFTIGPSGTVRAANVGSSTVGHRGVESCVTSKLKGWKFPKPVGGVNVKVTYPFVLNRLNRG